MLLITLVICSVLNNN